MDIGSVIAKYIELRDRKAEIAKRQAEELAPLSEAMVTMENWLLHQMNAAGVDSLKSNGVGTAFKANATSCQMADAQVFKGFIFNPAVAAVIQYFKSALDFDPKGQDYSAIERIIQDTARWDMVDFRAGKKGIQEFIANESTPVPGVNINTVTTVNVRRA